MGNDYVLCKEGMFVKRSAITRFRVMEKDHKDGWKVSICSGGFHSTDWFDAHYAATEKLAAQWASDNLLM